MIMDRQYAPREISSNLMTQLFRKALICAGVYGRVARYLHIEIAKSENMIVDTYRTLAQYQDDFTAYDLFSANIAYDGPPEGVEILLAHSSLQFECFDVAEGVGAVPPLAMALLCYSRTFLLENSSRFDCVSCVLQAAYLPARKQWEPLIKRFIHKGADLHVPVPRHRNSLTFTQFTPTRREHRLTCFSSALRRLMKLRPLELSG